MNYAQAVKSSEAARRIGVTPKTLKWMRCKGKGPPFVKLGESKQSGVVYDLADIEAWLAERKFASTTECSPAAVPPAKRPVRG